MADLTPDLQVRISWGLIAESFHSQQSLSVSCLHVILGLPGPRFPLTCMSKAVLTAKNWQNLPNSNSKPAELSSGNKNMDMYWADNFIKNWQNLPISDPKPDLHKMNAYTKLGKNLLIFTQVIVQKAIDIYSSYLTEMKILMWPRQITLPNSNPKTRSPQYQCTHQVWWKSIDSYSSYHPETKIWLDWQMYNRQMDGKTDTQTTNVIP